MKLNDKQDLMSACGWVSPKEKLTFQMFPQGVHVDTNSNTNNNNQPIVTITLRYTKVNVVTVLWIFMPNECPWDFWWLFEVVLPTLLGDQSLSPVNVISTDGDPDK